MRTARRETSGEAVASAFSSEGSTARRMGRGARVRGEDGARRTRRRRDALVPRRRRGRGAPRGRAPRWSRSRGGGRATSRRSQPRCHARAEECARSAVASLVEPHHVSSLSWSEPSFRRRESAPIRYQQQVCPLHPDLLDALTLVPPRRAHPFFSVSAASFRFFTSQLYTRAMLTSVMVTLSLTNARSDRFVSRFFLQLA